MVTLFYQTAIDHVYFYEIEFAKLIIRYQCGNTTFIISSFGNPNAKNTAEDLILQILENRIRETVKEVEDVD